MEIIRIKHFLDRQIETYEQEAFIEADPISIPHAFSKLQDIEIAGFLSATIAWGNRTAIIKNARRIIQLMDDAPYDFVLQHTDKDLKSVENFVHRTFNGTDLRYFIQRLKQLYVLSPTLENHFFPEPNMSVKAGLIHFYNQFFLDVSEPIRTMKHVSTPHKASACKRLNMFLRWMVRRDSVVDFGIWKSISPAQLMIPLDVHTSTIARRLGILDRKQNDWKAVEALTQVLSSWDPADPVKYDYALFSLGVLEKSLDV